jgi:CubicO group peptidase (beta-lactamase class C family)
LYSSPNWIKATIESPLAFDPGEKMRYNTFQTHLLSGIITKATQKSTLKYGKEFLFDPMGIDVDEWKQDPQGAYFGGNEMYFTSQEVALFGYLYLNHGFLNGRQIVPSAWVDSSLSPSTNNTHPNEWGAFKNYNYAHLWWLGQINGKEHVHGVRLRRAIPRCFSGIGSYRRLTCELFCRSGSFYHPGMGHF